MAGQFYELIFCFFFFCALPFLHLFPLCAWRGRRFLRDSPKDAKNACKKAKDKNVNLMIWFAVARIMGPACVNRITKQ